MISGIGHRAGADDVVLDRLTGVEFHQRYMFVGGGVDHDLGPMLNENLCHPTDVGNVTDDRDQVDRHKIPPQFPFNIEEGVLGLLDQQQTLRSELTDLSTHLRTDRSARPRHQDHLILDKSSNRIQIQLYGLASQEVVDVYVTDLGHTVLARGDVDQGRNRTKADLGSLAHLNHAA